MTIKGEKGQQLAMFMTVGELANMPSHDAVDRHGVPMPAGSQAHRRLMASKVRESKTGSEVQSRVPVEMGSKPSLYNAIRDRGIEEPVTIAHDLNNNTGGAGATGAGIWDGNHRVATAAKTRPHDELVPVQHIDDENYRTINWGR